MNNVLVIGNGGREHALAWKLQQSPKVHTVFVGPGNGGTQNNIDIDINKASEIAKFCEEAQISLVVVGPEVPLSNGLVDELMNKNPNLMVFGPTRNNAQLESSKLYAKEFMKEFDLPTADFIPIKSAEEIEIFLENLKWNQVVLKADGLAAGKGVVLPTTIQEIRDTANSMLKGQFGEASHQIIAEEKLDGYEVSALAFVDGNSFAKMPLVKDHKRLLNNDEGPNTGGMGVVSPIHVSEKINHQIDQIFKKTLNGLKKRGLKYCGVLYAGFMITNDTPYLLEFNCRFGDPETEILMRLLNSDLFEILTSCVKQKLSTCEIEWSSKYSCGVILASENYPAFGNKGAIVSNIPEDNPQNVVFHAGTLRNSNNEVITNGGRILCVTSVCDDLVSARKSANNVASTISFPGKQYRTDIGENLANPTVSLSYGASGVNIDEGNQFVEDIKVLVKKTLLPGASQIGGFGAVLDLQKAGFHGHSQLVVGIDGVGTKIEVASACQNYSNIGYDVVGMCVNDIICHCARPIAFLDYFVCGKLEREMATKVLSSISKACIETECSLIGGETAEMPGVYLSNQWDLAGCAIASRSTDWPALPLSSSISEDDVIIGLPSSGLHSNGFSLARKIIEVNGVKYSNSTPWNNNITFGEELLKGTKLYVKSVLPLLIDGLVKGCAHITGGGLIENAIRVLEKDGPVKLVIDASKWKPAEIFNWLAASGPVDTLEMIRTFNCGIGMILIVNKTNVESVKKRLIESGEDFHEIGHVAKRTGEKQIEIINENRLFNRNVYKVERKKVKVAILISGNGSNMQKLIQRAKAPDSNTEVSIVVSNKPEAGGLDIAKSFGVPTRVIPHTTDRITGEMKIIETLHEFNIELICLAGYMRVLSQQFVRQFPSRIINIHPSLLPAFKGAHALEDALKFGVKVVGCTAHFVDEFIDNGEIIGQSPVIVENSDTIEILREKIQKEEHVLFPKAMIQVAEKILKNSI